MDDDREEGLYKRLAKLFLLVVQFALLLLLKTWFADKEAEMTALLLFHESQMEESTLFRT